MSAWSRRRARRAEERRRRAHNRLHGVGAVSRPPARRRSGGGWDDVGEFLVDVLLALPRFVIWLFAKAFGD